MSELLSAKVVRYLHTERKAIYDYIKWSEFIQMVLFGIAMGVDWTTPCLSKDDNPLVNIDQNILWFKFLNILNYKTLVRHQTYSSKCYNIYLILKLVFIMIYSIDIFQMTACINKTPLSLVLIIIWCVSGWISIYIYYYSNKYVEEIEQRVLNERASLLDTMETTLEQENIENTTECPICMDNYVEDSTITKLSCNHLFHRMCIERWTVEYGNDNCPSCRSDIV
jgi:hypothetical protein